MLKRWQRVILDKSNVQTDVSLIAQNGTGFDFGITGGSDYLYVGQYFPFNALYFQMSGNGISPHDPSGVTVQYWSGSGWTDANDLLDDTTCFHSSGVVQFQPNKNTGWTAIADTEDESASEIDAFSIYDLYWIRVGLKAGHAHSGLTCKFVGYKFCKNDDLVKFDPEINEYLVPWGGASKTNWDEQILLASESVVSELKMRGLIVHEGQILRFDDVYEATVYKTLMIIYGQLGESFQSKFEAAKREYDMRMSKQRWTFDRNKDAMVSHGELENTVVEIVR